METINPEKLLIKIAPILDKLGIGYFITGGFAISVWGRPRATFDIDIVVKLIDPQVSDLAKALKKISKFGYMDEETAKRAIVRKGEFNFIDSETGIKVDFWVAKNDEASLVEFSRKVAKKINNTTVYFISSEDLILSKLIWYEKSQSTRQLEDIESILKIQKKLDLRYIRKWAKKQSTIKIFENLLKKIKRIL